MEPFGAIWTYYDKFRPFSYISYFSSFSYFSHLSYFSLSTYSSHFTLFSYFSYFPHFSYFSYFSYSSYFSYISCLFSSGALQNISHLGVRGRAGQRGNKGGRDRDWLTEEDLGKNCLARGEQSVCLWTLRQEEGGRRISDQMTRLGLVGQGVLPGTSALGGQGRDNPGGGKELLRRYC